jgi:competence protein ComEA
MSALTTKRLLVYVAAGAVVLVTGVLGLVSMRGASGSGGSVLLDTAAAPGVGGEQGLALAGEGRALLDAGEPAEATTTTEPPQIWVQVAGAVVLPGVYCLSADARVFEALAEAGGATADADKDAVAMAATLFDGCRVYVPKVGEMPAGTVVGPTTFSAGVFGSPVVAETSRGSVSLNTATAEQLDTLPGIGPALAAQIVAYRESQGPFTSVEQLTDVPGIGSAKLEQLRPLVGL